MPVSRTLLLVCLACVCPLSYQDECTIKGCTWYPLYHQDALERVKGAFWNVPFTLYGKVNHPLFLLRGLWKTRTIMGIAIANNAPISNAAEAPRYSIARPAMLGPNAIPHVLASFIQVIPSVSLRALHRSLAHVIVRDHERCISEWQQL